MSKEFDKNISDWRHDCTSYKNDLDFFLRLVKWSKKAKIFRNFRNKSRSILMLHKISKKKKCAPKFIFFNEKKIEKDSDNFWYRKLTLKVRNCHFLIAWFRAEVDLTKNLFDEKVLLFTQLTSHLMSSLLKKS